MVLTLKLLGAASVNIVLSVIFFLLKRKTPFQKLPYLAKQVIIGVVFGLSAIFGTEFGVDVGGAVANARDAAPLCAGLLFGPTAGIIAGIIGGVERWFAVIWGAGMYSRVACSLSTIIAGFYAAFLRKHMFDDKRPTPGFGLAIAVVMEVFHMSVLFLTHLSDPVHAYEIVEITTIPMVFCNAAAIFLSILAISFLSSGIRKGQKRKPTIAQRVQSRMLLCIILAYIITTVFVFALQTNSAITNAENLNSLNLSDVCTIVKGRQPEEIPDLVSQRHIGESGYVLVTDKQMNILGNSRADTSESDRHGVRITPSMTSGELIKAEVYGEDCYIMYRVAGDYYVIIVLPYTEVFATRDAAAYLNSFMEVLVFAVLFAQIYFLIKKLVVNNIRSVNSKLEKIIGGDLDVTVDVRSSSEFSSLSDDINSTVTTLKHYIDEAAARIDKELQMAQNIQASALPSVFPPYPNVKEFDIYATMDTAKEVGGDFYDFYMLNDDKLVFLIADVSGKGIPAAMFMMRAKTMIKNFAEEGFAVNEVFTNANEKLCEGNDAGMFVTAWMGILDIHSGHVQYVNAGHNPPLLYRKDEGYEYLKGRSGFILAGMEGVSYKMQELDLAPGDKIYLYTDGVTEATNQDKNLYGEERLRSYLNDHVSLTAKETAEKVSEDIASFVGDMEQFDDITMLVLDYSGKGKGDNMVERVFPADDSALESAIAFIEEQLDKADCGVKTKMQIDVALEEMFVNVAHYAYPGTKGDVSIAVFCDNRTVTIRLTDSGIPFDPLAKADPDLTVPAAERSIGGLGIFMVKKTMDSVAYVNRDGKNIFTMTKKI